MKNRTIEAEHELEALESKVGQLERVREKQAKKIEGLKGNLEYKDAEVANKKQSINNTIQALSSELRTTKAALDEVTKHERQVCPISCSF